VFFTTVSYPIKGTPYYEEVGSKLVQLGAWSTGTDRDVKIQGRHSRRFYQIADQLLRSQTAAEADLARQGLQAAYSEVEA
jgi:anaerobic magnesium-protoporphyrin IX monomethyl ester cyclase